MLTFLARSIGVIALCALIYLLTDAGRSLVRSIVDVDGRSHATKRALGYESVRR